MADLPLAPKRHSITPPDDVLAIWKEARMNELKSTIEKQKQAIKDIELVQLLNMKAELRMREEELKNYLAIEQGPKDGDDNTAKEGNK